MIINVQIKMYPIIMNKMLINKLMKVNLVILVMKIFNIKEKTPSKCQNQLIIILKNKICHIKIIIKKLINHFKILKNHKFKKKINKILNNNKIKQTITQIYQFNKQ